MLQRANVRRKLLAAVAALAATTGAQAQLIVNGGFEDPAFADDGGHYVRTTGTQLTGWATYSSNGGTILFNTGFDPVAEGNQAVEIEVAGDWISQSFATIAGANYRLSFDLSAYTMYGGPGSGSTLCPCASFLDVGVGSAWTSFVGSSAEYTAHTFDFTAESSSTTVTFMSPFETGYRNYPHLDNVSVDELAVESMQRLAAPIPEPETYALMLAGLAFLRWRTAPGTRTRRERRDRSSAAEAGGT